MDRGMPSRLRLMVRGQDALQLKNTVRVCSRDNVAHCGNGDLVVARSRELFFV